MLELPTSRAMLATARPLVKDFSETNYLRIHWSDFDDFFHQGISLTAFQNCATYMRIDWHINLVHVLLFLHHNLSLITFLLRKVLLNSNTLCLKKDPDIFTCYSSKPYLIFIIFGKSVTKKLSNQNRVYFLPYRIVLLHYLVKHKRQKCIFSIKCLVWV